MSSNPEKCQNALDHPIPVAWLQQAAHLPGKSIHLAIALVQARASCLECQIELTNTLAAQFGLDRASKYRALAWLEKAGLVSVSRKTGRSPLVSLENLKSHSSTAPV